MTDVQPQAPLSLAGRRVAVYIGGSIAAYKAGEVVTLLRKRGAEVRVAMTAGAQHFVTPLTFQSLSGHPVAAGVWDAPAETAHGMEHLALSAWCEVQVGVAVTADLIAKLALGMADDAVTTAALACRGPLLLAPAMETAMWEHPATEQNAGVLRTRGAWIIGPASGRLASGREGAGRMVEPAEIVDAVSRTLQGLSAIAGPVPASGPGAMRDLAYVPAPGGADAEGWLAGEHVVVTSGGTREPIDPVRYIGNRSSGKMGLALAREALRLGAHVTLVTSAPPPPPQPGLDVVEVETAAQMDAAVRSSVWDAAVLIMAAAVADYRPAEVATRKIKKSGDGMTLDLVPTVDILRSLRDERRPAQLCVVGFAAETDDLLANARQKLEAKGLDLIVANDVGRSDVGMGSDDNAVVIVGPGGVVAEVGRAPKPEVARSIFAAIRSVRGTAG
ncbi:MAG TPA: bifunctional phosphopantothenoylcysteine decarboxylase/phosphopantothenate synthase [Candidatus Dormibacteraeota bacterium]|jgi:phosphopantothenoylcysteine decarboxylase/phosphopantothenate--cysteine ligase|nr:bifunctional phosphopantothenoylcysteine decarboxylase/phosphopantothenate synthase [Candidatus Dormibacteraeota bacterium]